MRIGLAGTTTPSTSTRLRRARTCGSASKSEPKLTGPTAAPRGPRSATHSAADRRKNTSARRPVVSGHSCTGNAPRGQVVQTQTGAERFPRTRICSGHADVAVVAASIEPPVGGRGNAEPASVDQGVEPRQDPCRRLGEADVKLAPLSGPRGGNGALRRYRPPPSPPPSGPTASSEGARAFRTRARRATRNERYR